MHLVLCERGERSGEGRGGFFNVNLCVCLYERERQRKILVASQHPGLCPLGSVMLLVCILGSDRR